MSILSSYKKIFVLGFVIIILIAIPFSVYIAQQRQNISSKADKATVLSLEPAFSTAKVGDIVTLEIFLDPTKGTAGSRPNQVSFVRLSIGFTPTEFTVESLTPNIMEKLDEPQYDTGKASISLSIGANPANAITTRTKIAILKLKAIAATTSTDSRIIFDPDSSVQILSIDVNSQTSDNVLSTTIPATVTIAAAAVVTSTPTPTASPSATVAGAPACASLNVDRATTGTAPYSLTFTAIGSDSDGTISKATFNFGDGPAEDVTTGGGIGTNSINTQISHTYNNAGTYTVYAILTDNNDNLSTQQAGCTKTITVSSAGLGGGIGGDLPVLPIQTIIPTVAPVINLPPAALPPTGPGEKILGIGAIGIVLMLIGGALLILL